MAQEKSMSDHDTTKKRKRDAAAEGSSPEGRSQERLILKLKYKTEGATTQSQSSPSASSSNSSPNPFSARADIGSAQSSAKPNGLRLKLKILPSQRDTSASKTAMEVEQRLQETKDTDVVMMDVATSSQRMSIEPLTEDYRKTDMSLINRIDILNKKRQQQAANWQKANPQEMVASPFIKVPVYPYQALGIESMIASYDTGLGGFINADDMGLGKTLQAIGVIQYIFQREQKKTLVIVPLSVATNWLYEIEKFSDLRACIYQGLGAKEEKGKKGKKKEEKAIKINSIQGECVISQREFDQYHVYIATYDRCVASFINSPENRIERILKKAAKDIKAKPLSKPTMCNVFLYLKEKGYLDKNGDVTEKVNDLDDHFPDQMMKNNDESLLEALLQQELIAQLKLTYSNRKQDNRTPLEKQQPFGMVILDEAHRVRNKGTERNEKLQRIPTDFRLLLTGTPIQNALEDLYELVNFANQNFFDRNQFKEYLTACHTATLELESWVWIKRENRVSERLFAVNHYSELPEVERAIAKLRQLSELVSPIMLRREKVDESILAQLQFTQSNAQLLSKKEVTIEYVLTPEQQELVNFLSKVNRELIQQAMHVGLMFDSSMSESKDLGNALSKLQQMLMVLAHPSLLNKKAVRGYQSICRYSNQITQIQKSNVSEILSAITDGADSLESGKINQVLSIYEDIEKENPDDKVIVSVHYIKSARILIDKVRKQFNQTALYLYGSTSLDERQLLADIFNGKIKTLTKMVIVKLCAALINQWTVQYEDFLEKQKVFSKNDGGKINQEMTDIKLPKELRPCNKICREALVKSRSVKEFRKEFKKEFKKQRLSSLGKNHAEIIRAHCQRIIDEEDSIENFSDNSLQSFIIKQLISWYRAKVLILNYKSGGEGLNLQGGNNVIIFDSSWNPADDKQVTCRAYRLGQSKPVVIYRLITKGDLTEQRILRKARLKESLASTVIDQNATGESFFGEIYQTILEDQDLAAQFIELERRYQVKEAIHIPAKKEQQLSASDSDDGTNSENLANGQHSMASGSATVYEPVPLSDNRYGFLSETTNTVPLRSLWGEEDERIDSTSTAASAVPPYPFWSDQDELPPLMKGAPSSPFLGAAPLNEITDGDDFWTMFNREFN